MNCTKPKISYGFAIQRAHSEDLQLHTAVQRQLMDSLRDRNVE
jgi:hypothetical protein